MKIKFQCLMSIALVNRNSEVNISIMAGVLLETGTACPSRGPGFTPGIFLGGFLLLFDVVFFFFFLQVCVARRFSFICCFVLFYFVVFLFFFVFGLSLVYPILPVSLDYRFFIAPSVFSNVYC